MNNESLSLQLKRRALELGFDAVGITGPEVLQTSRADLRQYVQEKRHAGMNWLSETEKARSDPGEFFPETKSVVMVALNYFRKRETVFYPDEYGTISLYARGRDYHKVLRKKLKLLAAWILENVPESRSRIFVDSFPIMEKPLAMRAGLGWIAKNTTLIMKGKGSYYFLGGLLLNIALPADEPLTEDYCGSCQKCLEACPSGALDEPFKIDSNKCLSYLTIEHRQAIHRDFHPVLGNLIFGCDICQEICPWNRRFARTSRETDFKNRFSRTELKLNRLKQLSRKQYEKLFEGTPVRRSGYERFMENVRIALDNHQKSGKG